MFASPEEAVGPVAPVAPAGPAGPVSPAVPRAVGEGKAVRGRQAAAGALSPPE